MDSERIFRDLETLIEQRHLSPRTFTSYRSGIRDFCRYYKDKDHPKNINKQEIIEFLAWVKREKGVAKELQCFWALHFLYVEMMEQKEKFNGIKKPKVFRKIPEVITHKEFMKAFDRVRNPHEKAILALFYSTGLRIGELCRIECVDVNRSNKSIFIRRTKGNKTLNVPISDYLMGLLDKHWLAMPIVKRQFKRWLFPGSNPNNHICSSAVWRIVKDRIVVCRAGNNVRVYPHLLRHSFATYLHEHGEPLKAIADRLGHASTKPTEIYVHTSLKMMHDMVDPFECKKVNFENNLALITEKAA